MADLSVNFCGIKSPNPFWLASAPPTDKAYKYRARLPRRMGRRRWKTLGEEGPPVVNVSGPRYGVCTGRIGASPRSTTSSSSPTGRSRSTFRKSRR